jgi:RNA polymerase sigma-70 factor (ECF subfamily)
MHNNVEGKSDEEVVELVRSSDRNMYRIIVERYEQKLFRYVDRMISDSDASADIVQQAFIKAFVNLRSFDVTRKFNSWIYRIAHNETMNYLKKRKKEVQLSDTSLIDKIFHRGNNETEDTIEQGELMGLLNEVVGELPIEYRSPLTLFYLDEKSYEEISEILRIPTSTVGTRIRRGKMKAKDLYLQKHGKQ